MRRPLRSDTARALSNLAIELGDPGRMARARKLHRAGSVGEIAVDSGELTTLVYGSQPDPYTVRIVLDEAHLGSSTLPEPEQVSSSCTCPDGLTTCKHALATVLTFAEEVEADARLLDAFLGRSSMVVVESADEPIDADPFFSGTGVHSLSFGPFEPLQMREAPVMMVEATDAWPVFDHAISAIARDVGR